MKRKHGYNQFIDMTGKRFGSWLVIKPTEERRPGQGIYWDVQCDCGTLSSVFGSSLRMGASSQCVQCRDKKSVFSNQGYHDGGLKCKYNQMKNEAIDRRHLQFKLSLEQYIAIVLSPCFYCNQEPYQFRIDSRGEVVSRNGIDRWDNNLGYCDYNVVPCCGVCNHMKGTMHGDDFLKQVYRINN